MNFIEILTGIKNWCLEKFSPVKRGIVSQTQTWTKADDGGYDYVMSDQAQGLIPQSNIDLFESAGAVFNEETGYFELNGLTDLSYEEMKEVYISAPLVGMVGYSGGMGLRYGAFRTLPYFKNNDPVYWGNVFNMNKVVEIIVVDSVFKISNLQNAFHSCSNLRSITGGYINISYVTSATGVSYTFFNCTNLEDVKLFGLKFNISFAQSGKFSTESVLYMINNEAATSAITITLHPTAYARATADEEIQSALQQHTNVTLATA